MQTKRTPEQAMTMTMTVIGISVESKSLSLAFSIDANVRSPASSWSIVGDASASLTALGAWPGVAAKVVDGVSAMSRLAAAVTSVCERQCGGSISQR